MQMLGWKKHKLEKPGVLQSMGHKELHMTEWLNKQQNSVKQLSFNKK